MSHYGSQNALNILFYLGVILELFFSSLKNPPNISYILLKHRKHARADCYKIKTNIKIEFYLLFVLNILFYLFFIGKKILQILFYFTFSVISINLDFRIVLIVFSLGFNFYYWFGLVSFIYT